jgi:CubicO group peptidase (beta-lactamase class C family)
MKRLKLIITTALFICIFVAAKSNSHNDSSGIKDSIEIKIDTMIAQMGLSSETPGGVVGVIKDGRLIFEKGYGLANLETKEQITPSTLFNLASVSKQFTAAAVLQLVNEQKLSVKDDIRKYLPDFPDYGRPITIENLIHHTSGIKSFDVLRLMAGTLFLKETYDDSYDLILKQKSLNFNPGEEYEYSNSGYVLLARIIEKVSGMKFSKFMEERIFQPTGMNRTFIYDDPEKIILSSAVGYINGGDKKFRRSADLNSTVVGSTNVYTCVEDFLQWDNNFYKNKLGGWEFSKAMTNQVLLNNGDKCNYAFGLEISEHNGLKTISHQGGTEGFQAMYVQIPSEKFAVVCLFNTGIDVTGLAYKITDLYVKGTPNAENVSIQHEIAKVDSSILQKYVGNYFDESFWMDATITRETDHLFFNAPYAGRFEIFPSSDTSFYVTFADLKFIFSKNNKGEITKTTLIQGDQKIKLTYLGTDIFPLKSEELNQYAGNYYCEEIDVTYPVLFKDNKLFVRFPESTAKFCNTKVESELISEHSDYFATPVRGLQFTRNTSNEIVGFIIRDVGRVRNLVFSRKP